MQKIKSLYKMALIVLCSFLIVACTSIGGSLTQASSNKNLYYLNVYPNIMFSGAHGMMDKKAKYEIDKFMKEHPEYKSYKIVKRDFVKTLNPHYKYTILLSKK